MSDEFEAAGTMIDGGLLAKAADDEAKALHKEGAAVGTCLNCQAPVTRGFCGNCGQPLHVHRSLGAFWHDILHGVLHFEGKFWRTLPLLVWKPGELTRRYVHGERAKFISPMALFLFSVFMMFAVFSFIATPFSTGDDNSNDAGFATSAQAESVELEEKLQQKIKDLETAEGEDRADIQEDILDMKRSRNLIATMTMSDPPYPEIELRDDATGNDDAATDVAGATTTEAGSERQPDNDQAELWDALKNSPGGQMLKSGLERASENPRLLFYKLKANGYKFAWLLIPISIPFIWLTLIGRRGLHFYDHAVFATYSIAFMSLLFVACAILAAFGVSDSIWASLLIFYPPFHMYRQLRHSFDMSRPEALVRVFFLLIFTVISLTLFFIILLALGILG